MIVRAAVLAGFLATHPFAPTARVNVYCIVPSIGLGPSIAAVRQLGIGIHVCNPHLLDGEVGLGSGSFIR